MENKQFGREISSSIQQINALIKKKLRKALESSDLTPPQIMVLHMLSEHQNLKINEISQKMNLANSTVSGIVDRLEKMEYVSRVRSKADRRFVHVEPTEKSNQLHQELSEKVNEYMQDIVQGADRKEIETILIGLDTLKKLLAENPQTTEGESMNHE